MRYKTTYSIAGLDETLPADAQALGALVSDIYGRLTQESWDGSAQQQALGWLQALREHYRTCPSAFAASTIECLRQLKCRVQQQPLRPTCISEVLRNDFGYTSFRAGQQTVIEAVLGGHDAIAIMPTGGGKSLCYQLPARILGGVTLVVSPLIALMKDQVDALLEMGIHATYLNSSLTPEERRGRIDEIRSGKYQLLYAAPEGIDASVGSLLDHLPIRLIAVDEAHCISHWGHDFRPAYRQLRGLKLRFPVAPILALTATATRRVADDIAEQLGMHSPLVHRGSCYRPNLRLAAHQKGQTLGMTTKEAISRFVRTRCGQSGIVYCLSRKATQTTASWLQGAGIRAAAYHAGLSIDERTRVQNGYRNDEIDVIVATIAFGMGLDKSNVRYVIHQDMPRSIEGYMQEIGRAGRDGLDSDCVLFYSWSDVLAYDRLAQDLDDENSKNRLKQQARAMFQLAQSEGCRQQNLVAHFDEPIEPCQSACDNCRPRASGYSSTAARPAVPRSSETAALAATGDATADPMIQQRFDRLRALRLTLARERQVPAYVVFSDATLLAMANANPGSLDELANIPGVGKKKLETYGEQFVALLRAILP